MFFLLQSASMCLWFLLSLFAFQHCGVASFTAFLLAFLRCLLRVIFTIIHYQSLLPLMVCLCP